MELKRFTSQPDLPKLDEKQQLIVDYMKRHPDALVDEVCEVVGIKRVCLWKWKKKFPQFAEILEQDRQELIAMGEGNIHKAVRNGDLETTKWMLERLSPEYRKNGIELNGDDGIISNFTFVKAVKDQRTIDNIEDIEHEETDEDMNANKE